MPIAKKKREKIYSRDKGECVYCGSEENLTLDHFIPLFHGGTNAISNLQTLCSSCNNKKGDRMPTDEEISAHEKRLSECRKRKAVNWDKLKLPPVGLSDGMVRSKSRTYKEFESEVLKILSEPDEEKIPRYVKVIGWCCYADFWLGVKKEDIGKIYCTDDKKENWKFVLKQDADCFEKATKLQWNLSRNHGTPEPVKVKSSWSWESYNESVRKRAAAL